MDVSRPVEHHRSAVSGRVLPLAAGVALLLFVPMGLIAVNWVRAQRVYQPILAALPLRKGAPVATLANGDNFPYLANPVLDHVPKMAVITRDTYLNTLFADRGKQVLQVVYGSTASFKVAVGMRP